MTDPQLPQQLILDIVYFCDVSTLKSLRLAHRSLRDLLDTYQISICSNAKARLFQTEEIDCFQLLDGSCPALLALFALEYRVRTAKWLAAVGLENNQEDEDLYRPGLYGNVGANEVQGDPIRSYITVGWGVLWRLADIARNVVSEMTDINVLKSRTQISSLTRGYRFVRKLETKIKEMQLEYIHTLPFRGRESYGYFLMHGVSSRTFADRVFDDPRGKASDWRTGNEYTIGNSWLNWLVLREGPRLFIRAWGSKEGNEECSRLITTEWSKRLKEQLSIEHAAAKDVEESLLRSSNATNEALRRCALVDWVRSGREIERVFPDVTFHLGRRLPRDVIRSIEREYSDYSS